MKKSPLYKKKKIIIPILLLVIALSGFIAYKKFSGSQQHATVPETAKVDNNDDINFDPPTEEEKTNNDALKEKLGNDIPQQPPANGQKRNITPIISFWGQSQTSGAVEVGAFVSGVFEGGGKCTLNLSKDSQEATAATNATKDATTTTCGTISIARNSLSAGKWKATVKYVSDSSEGSSEGIYIEVQ